MTRKSEHSETGSNREISEEIAYHLSWEVNYSEALQNAIEKALDTAYQRGYTQGREKGIEEAAKKLRHDDCIGEPMCEIHYKQILSLKNIKDVGPGAVCCVCKEIRPIFKNNMCNGCHETREQFY